MSQGHWNLFGKCDTSDNAHVELIKLNAGRNFDVTLMGSVVSIHF